MTRWRSFSDDRRRQRGIFETFLVLLLLFPRVAAYLQYPIHSFSFLFFCNAFFLLTVYHVLAAAPWRFEISMVEACMQILQLACYLHDVVPDCTITL